MKRRLVCLANSYKEKGRCVAGIELDKKGNPIIENGRHKWIRPVSIKGHGEILTNLVSDLNVLDILEIDVTEECPDKYQSENVFFSEDSVKSIGVFDKAKLSKACEDSKYIFATRYPSLSEEVIEQLSYSLMLVETEVFEVTLVPNEYSPKHPKPRLKFSYNNFEYDLPITDPDFLSKHKANPKVLSKKNKIVLCLSLGVKIPATGRYYKLVAGIIY
jgi:hypothetical protein